jgi:TP53 regulating kinase and related kinases
MIIKQGAEARIHLLDFLGKKVIAKQRFKKKYRLQELDEKLVKERMIQEARQLVKVKVNTPTIYFIDLCNSTIYMEYIDAPTVRDYLQLGRDKFSEIEQLGRLIGTELSLIHNQDCIHGDVTTCNILYHAHTHSITWIDFGLSYCSTLCEDKAVDLYILERAILSTHPQHAVLFQSIVHSYGEGIEDKKVLQTFENGMDWFDVVRLRGRKRSQLG